MHSVRSWTAEGGSPHMGRGDGGENQAPLHYALVHAAGSGRNDKIYLTPVCRRLYFFRTSRRRSWGKAMTSWLSTPVMVSAATMAFTTASSVACTVARNMGSRESLGSMVSWWRPLVLTAPGLAVENARKMLPEPSPE